MLDRFIVNSSVAATQTQQTLTSSDTPYQLGFKNSLKTTVNTGVNFATAGTGYLYPCQQLIEAYNIQDLNWGTSFGVPMTVSFWIRSNIPSGSQSSVTVTNSLHGSSTGYSIRIPFTYYATATWQYVTITCPPPPNGTPWNTGTGTGLAFTISSVNYNTPGSTINANPNVWESTTTSNRQGLYNDYLIAQTAGNYIEFTGVQLEKGTVATGFEFRPFAQELALCQRYYYQVNAAGGTYTPFGSGWSSGVGAYVMIPHPVVMRDGPSLFTSSAVLTFSCGAATGSNPSPAGLTVQNKGNSATLLTLSVAGITAGQGLTLQANNSSTAFLGFSSEL
jgi:hypothetical protein